MRSWKVNAASLAVLLGLCAGQVFAQSSRSVPSGTSSFSAGRTSGTAGQGSAGGFGTSTAGQLGSSDRFLRDNRQAGDFVGSAQDAQSFVGAVGSGSTTSGRSPGVRGGGARGSTANRSTGRGQRAQEIRATISVGFATRPAITPVAADALAARMNRSSWIQNRSPIEVSIESATATLRGAVASEHDRALAERLALLEAGIWTVKNELVVESAATDQSDSPLNLTVPAPNGPSAASD